MNASASGIRNGTTWHDSYTDLQDALNDARTQGGCPCEIWIAGGTYKPDRGSGDRAASFELADDTTVYGGFAGSETDPSQRDCVSHETILNGDLNGDDDWDLLPTSSCCSTHHEPGCDNNECVAAVASYWSRCQTAIWSITCVGLSESLCCDLCRPTRCDNSYHVLSVPASATVAIDGLTVVNGEAHGPDVTVNQGAGLYAPDADSNVTIRECVFEHNMAAGFDAIYAYVAGSEITNTLITENGNAHRTGPSGPDASAGPVAFLGGTSGTIQSTFFVRNGGGGLRTGTNGLIDGCVFEGNHGYYSLQFYPDSSPLVTDCVFRDNDQTTVETGIYAPTFVNCRFLGNWNSGRGATLAGSGFITLENCSFDGNRAAARKCPDELGSPGAIESGGTVVIRNSTFTNNVGHTATAVLANTTIENSIFYGNIGDVGLGAGIAMISPGVPDISYSIIQGQTEQYPGIGNLDVDPMFVDPLGPDGVAGTEDDDLRLSPDSPAINAGDPNFTPAPEGETDLDGHPRILCGQVDIGAYEFGIGDYDCNQSVNAADFANWETCVSGPLPDGRGSDSPCTAFDFDADGDVDLKDFYGFQQVFVTP
ncbi:MAG: right-handed parallel beta-helix repeat-containing protein [Planctomycetes bacterium]|nr:right-handed parallel beta-helix repeat-containing protein [Planctomycetota bacterium]MBI3835675.1 right-handed parallel beta-helix repeat-containing protein [Planctomycetota bacterium]